MGRQVGFHAFPEDLREFVEFACRQAPVAVTLMDSDGPEVESLADPAAETRVMTLWNRELVRPLKRELVKRPHGPDYYRIPYSLPVLELSPSRSVSWNGAPGLLAGRLYGFSFDTATDAYGKWYDGLVRWIRSHFPTNPIKRLPGYVGPAALSWFQGGGILLPSLAPPVTPEWLSFVEAEEEARSTGSPQQRRRRRS